MNRTAYISLLTISNFASMDKLGAMDGDDYGCVYRSVSPDESHTLFCGIGCLLPDSILKKMYEDEDADAEVFDTMGAQELFSVFPELRKRTGFTASQAKMLQCIHDDIYKNNERSVANRKFKDIVNQLMAGQLVVFTTDDEVESIIWLSFGSNPISLRRMVFGPTNQIHYQA